MRYIPFGYRIENGKPTIVEEQASIIRKWYDLYLSGFSMKKAAVTAGIRGISDTNLGCWFAKDKYAGDGFFPPIVDKGVFETAQRERKRRARIRKGEKEKIEHRYRMREIEEKYDDPYRQAEYVYGLRVGRIV